MVVMYVKNEWNLMMMKKIEKNLRAIKFRRCQTNGIVAYSVDEFSKKIQSPRICMYITRSKSRVQIFCFVFVFVSFRFYPLMLPNMHRINKKLKLSSDSQREHRTHTHTTIMLLFQSWFFWSTNFSCCLECIEMEKETERKKKLLNKKNMNLLSSWGQRIKSTVIIHAFMREYFVFLFSRFCCIYFTSMKFLHCPHSYPHSHT